MYELYTLLALDTKGVSMVFSYSRPTAPCFAYYKCVAIAASHIQSRGCSRSQRTRAKTREPDEA